jgi:hypothetical protein
VLFPGKQKSSIGMYLRLNQCFVRSPSAVLESLELMLEADMVSYH